MRFVQPTASEDTVTTTAARPASSPIEHAPSRGWLARLGAWSGTHFRLVLVAWLGVLGFFGVFAPKVMSSLSGAGWQDSGSMSVKARDVIAKDFAGLGSTALQVVVVDKNGPIAADPAAQRWSARRPHY